MHGHGVAGRDTCLYLLRRGHSIALAPGGHHDEPNILTVKSNKACS